MSRSYNVAAHLSADEKRSLIELLLRSHARGKTFPLSFAQERLWFLNQLEPDLPYYNIPLAVRLIGKLDVAILYRALNEIIRRHEVLRTTFSMAEGLPVQTVSPETPRSFPLVDLSTVAECDREAEVFRLSQSEAHTSFDLEKGPLLRFTLLRFDNEEHVALLTMHHIVCDEWSMQILIREIASIYGAFLKYECSPLPDLRNQYADYAIWQRDWFKGQILQEQLDYWKQQLGGEIPVLDLPTDGPRAAVKSLDGANESIVLPARIVQSLYELGKKERLTRFMVMFAAVKALLYRYTGQENIALGTPIAGRTRSELEGLIGFFVNTLVMKTALSGSISFRDLMRRVKKVALGAYAHQDLPFERLVQELQPERTVSHTPLFQVVFTFQQGTQEQPQLPGLALRSLNTKSKNVKFDFIFGILESGPDTLVTIEYNTNLFQQSTIKRMLSHFKTLLESIVSDPDQPLWALQLLTDEELHQIRMVWNDTATDYPRDRTIQELFEQQAELAADAVAVVDGDRCLTYRELNEKANQLARYLRELGARPEVLVGICMERSLELVVGLLAILKAGAAYVTLDPDYPKQSLSFVLKNTGAKLSLTLDRLRPRLPENVEHVITLDVDWPLIAASSCDNLPNKTAPDNLAYVIHTSGSTGVPKGVGITHRGVVKLVKKANYLDFSPKQTFLQCGPPSFDASTWEIWGSLLNGSKLVIVGGQRLNIEELGHAIATKNVTTALLTTSLFQLMIEERLEDLKLVRELLTGGDAISAKHADMLLSEAKDIRLINAYGPAENTVLATCYEIQRDRQSGRPLPIGKPVSNTQVYVLDKNLQLAAAGVAGEIYIGGDGLARCYIGRPDTTAERFIPDLLGSVRGGRLYRSGDLGRYLPDGNIEFLGRVDHQIKIRGFRIELEEVESVLRRHPAVQEAAVIAREDTPGNKTAVAYVVPVENPLPSVSGLRNYLKERLPDYMIPSAFVLLNAMPKTAHGKLDRPSLPAPDQTARQVGGAALEPRDVLELRLIQIWQDILDARPIGVRDNFFALGGHSLMAVRLMAKIHLEFGTRLPLAILFQEPTVEKLAGRLRQQAEPFSSSPLVRIQPQGTRPPFFCVHPIGGNVLCYVPLARRLGSDQPFYAFQSTGLNGEGHLRSTIEDMADLYIENLRSVQPEGPYLLGGWSMGGVVAFEMARQLSIRGEKTSLLALFDSGFFVESSPAIEFSPDQLINAFAQDMGLSLGAQVFPRSDSQVLDFDGRLRDIIEQAKLADMIPEETELSEVRPLLRVFENNTRAMQSYTPQKVPARITLFRAANNLATGPVDPQMDWARLTTVGIDTQLIAGDHYSILREPRVEALAGVLNDCIEHAIAEASSERAVRNAQMV